MHLVRKIEPLSGARCLVILEEESFFPMYRRELGRYGIAEGDEISEEVFEELMKEVLPRRVRLRAMHLLQKMDRTEQQLRRKLKDSCYSPEMIEDAIAYVKSFHYIDDARYAFHYMDYRKDTHSRLQLRMELQEKGVSREDIQYALEQVSFPDEREQIRYWMEKKHFHPEEADRKEIQKFCQFLMRKGFSQSLIRGELE